MKNILCSSVGRKFLVGLTGIGVSGFALLHMSGNLLLFAGPEAYNKYCYQLTHNAWVYLGAEISLVALFGAHILLALWLAKDNRAARGVAPTSAGSGDKKASFASRTMVYSGLLLLAFLIFHLKDFRFGEHYVVIYDGVEMRDLYRLVVQEFREPLHIGIYVAALAILALHLSHGISAVFQSLGLKTSLDCRLRKLAYAFSALVAGGFVSQPLYLFFSGGR